MTIVGHPSPPAATRPETSATAGTFDDDFQAILTDRLAAVAVTAGPADADGGRLHSALTEATAGGKRFRPRLVEVVHRSLGGAESAALPSVAAAIELLHTAFVVHDDVIDGDDTRRGRSSVPGQFRAEALATGATPEAAQKYAVAGAVLAGDLALSAAIQVVSAAPASRPVVGRLLGLIDRALVVSASGELADVRFSLGTQVPSLGEVLTMEEHKTAVYSFELPMQAGAVLADAHPDLVDGVGEIGRLLGVAFQLRDDLLGVFGDPEVTGKSDVADLREGKCTPLVIHARTTTAWPQIARFYGYRAIGSAEAAVVRRALETCGSRAFVERLADRYVAAAANRATQLRLPADFIAPLTRLYDATGSRAS